MPWSVLCHTPGCGWRTHLAERSLAEGWQEFHQKTHPRHTLSLEETATTPEAVDESADLSAVPPPLELLPPAEMAVPLREAQPAQAPETAGRSPILIIEDSAYLRRQLAKRVAAMGERPLEATGALDGLQIAVTHRPGLILLDLGLPDLDGLAACQLLQTDPATAAIPLVAMGTDPVPGPAEIRTFCQAYLPKPVDLPTLRKTVARLGRKTKDSPDPGPLGPLGETAHLLATQGTRPMPPRGGGEPPAGRRATRYRVHLPVRFTVGVGDPPVPKAGIGITHDLSLTGACLDLSDRLAPGAELFLSFSNAPAPLQVAARVVWTEPAPRVGGCLQRVRHGVRFQAPSPAQRRTLSALLPVTTLPDRLGLSHPLPVLLRPDCDAELLDLSVAGAALVVHGPLPPAADCTLVLPASLGGLEVPTRIVYAHVAGARDDGWLEEPRPAVAGIAFADLPFEQQVKLTEAVALLRLESDPGAGAKHRPLALEAACATLGRGWHAVLNRVYRAKPAGCVITDVRRVDGHLHLTATGITPMFRGSIRQAEAESAQTCEACGSSSARRRDLPGADVRTLCAACETPRHS